MSIFVAGIEIKLSDKHVEAASDVVTGLGFKSPRLHSDMVRAEQESEANCLALNIATP